MKKNTKVVIIDDENKVIETIQDYISEHLPDVKIVGSANSVLEGIKVINREAPDLLLLDIEMPYANGFDLLECFPTREFDVIFITAYNEYAIQAFKANAVDYILKPFDEEVLINAIKKVQEMHEKQEKSLKFESINNLFDRLNGSESKKLKICTRAGVEFINMGSIVKLEADGNYTNISLEGNSPIYASKRIKDIEKMLPKHTFFRSHKSYIINLKKVERYCATDNSIIMSDNTVVSIAKNKKEAFLDNMEKFF